MSLEFEGKAFSTRAEGIAEISVWERLVKNDILVRSGGHTSTA